MTESSEQECELRQKSNVTDKAIECSTVKLISDKSFSSETERNQSTDQNETHFHTDAVVVCSLDTSVSETTSNDCVAESSTVKTELLWRRKWNDKNIAELTHRKTEEEKLSSSTRNKVDAIMQMLHDAEKQNAKTLTQMQVTELVQNTNSKQTRPVTQGQEPSVAEKVLMKFRSKIGELRNELSSKEELIESLKCEMKCNIEKHKNELETAIQIERTRFEKQQQMYDLDLEKRFQFIDTLLQDKEKWVTQSEQLTRDLKSQQEAYDTQMKGLKERMAVELRKQKNEWNQRESEKREKWMKEQKEEILHTTAKPKFSAMTEQHKTEIRRLKDKLEAQERALSQQEEHTIVIRQRLLQEREDCLEKERIRFHSHLVSEKEKLRIQLESELEKAKFQWRKEKDSLSSALNDTKLQTERKVQQLQESHVKAMRKQEDHHESEKEEIFSGTRAQIEQVKQECELCKEEWKESTKEELNRIMLEELSKAKNLFEKERDEEIEVVITKFEAEKEDLESNLRRRIVQLQHENAEQTRTINVKEDHIGKLSAELSRSKDLLEERTAREQEALEEKDMELSEAKKFETELNNKVTILQEEIERNRRQNREEMNKLKEKLMQQIAELEASRAVVISDLEISKQEKEDLRDQYQSELEALSSHVKDALQRKDAFITSLQKKLDSKAEEQQSMEQLLLEQTNHLEEPV